ncbi:MAG: hypothetical protein KVP17_003582 [Porospora cf. gigantea B]|uniref:uncharacterized protein n=1 Tax=Porospora cf. gigantea B TaxID=2853592 RepID=UPI0035717FC1|nr:MAG: hypothetical protein KVP17_003582 [Porospora cf. gigantea B]
MALEKCNQAIECLEKKEARLLKRIEEAEVEARERVRSNNSVGAITALKRKKLLQQDLDQLATSRLTLEQQIIQLHSAQTQQLAVEALATGISAQRSLNEKMPFARIDRIIEDLHEQRDFQQEFVSVLSQSGPDIEESDLLQQLTAIEDEEWNLKLQGAVLPPSERPSDITAKVEKADRTLKAVEERENLNRLTKPEVFFYD